MVMKHIPSRIFFGLCALVSMALVYTSPYVYADLTSSNFNILSPILNAGGGNTTSTNFGLGQSIGQSVIGTSTSSNFHVLSGFQYYTQPVQFTLLGTSVATSTGTVSLQWTTPVVRNGLPIVGYKLGVGTTPYSLTFQDVGANTSFVKTGLTNNVQYFFMVKAVTTGDAPLGFSNTVSVTPTGTTVTSGGGGGGGGGGGSTDSGGVAVSGMAYPNTKVTLLKDGAIVSTVVADPGAGFRMTVSSLAPGTYIFGVYTQDANGLKSPTYTFPVTITKSVTVTVDNIFLAPTIGVDSSEVKQGDPIGIFGTTAPNATVTLHVHSSTDFTNIIAASSVGRWFKQFDTSVLELGDHVTYSRSAQNDQVTDQSNTVAFVVGDQTLKNTNKNRSDLNNDGSVNIIDFSMLLYYWNRTPPVTSKADINKSGIVDIIDLSIMLYDWTG